jgi:hypothetical protein
LGEVPSWKTITNETVTENHTKVRKSWYFSIGFDGKTWENRGKVGSSRAGKHTKVRELERSTIF